jgi:allophanate hydrolase subunit 2
VTSTQILLLEARIAEVEKERDQACVNVREVTAKWLADKMQLTLAEARVEALSAALREIAKGPRDSVDNAPDGHPIIVVDDEATGYQRCLAIAKAALATSEQARTEEK